MQLIIMKGRCFTFPLIFLIFFVSFFIQNSLQQHEHEERQIECSSSADSETLYSGYLTCLAKSQNRKLSRALELDQELVNETRRLTEECFEATVAEARTNKKCFFDFNTLDTEGFAWNSRGPLKGCNLCLTTAKSAVEAIQNPNLGIAKCVRRVVFPAISREAGECFNETIPFWEGDPDIPDFEAESMKNYTFALEAISLDILQILRHEKCQQRNPEWAENTQKCLDNPKFDNFMEQHCKVINGCHQGLSPNCTDTLKLLEPPACRCTKKAGDVIKEKLQNIGKHLKKIYSDRPNDKKLGAATRPEIEECFQAIRNETVTNSNDWFRVIGRTLQKCGSKELRFKPILESFCSTIIRELGVAGTEKLDVAFDFLNALVDATIHRMARYCHDHCPQGT